MTGPMYNLPVFGAIAAFFILVIVACQMFGFTGLVLPAALFPLLILATHPRRLLMLFWVVTLFTPTAEILLPDFYVKITEQVFGLYLLAILLGHLIITREQIPGVRPANRFLIPLLCLMFVSAIINRVPAVPVLFYCLTYLKHFWVFYFCLAFLRKDDIRPLFHVLLLSFGVQIAFNLACWVGINPLPAMLGRGLVDSNMGTLGSSHYVGYYMITCMFVLVAWFFKAPSLAEKIFTTVGMMLTAGQFYLTYTMHAYPLLAAGMVVQYLASTRRVSLRLLKLSPAIIAAFMVVLAFAAIRPETVDAAKFLSPDLWKERWQQMRRGFKGQAYEQVVFNASEHLPYPFFGGGPGNYTSNIAAIMRRPLAMRPHLAYLSYTVDPSARRIASYGSVLNSTAGGYLALWGELGPLGFLLYWGFYIYAGIRVWRNARRGLYHDHYRQILADAFVPVTAVMVAINAIIDSVPMLHLTLGYWIWAAALWNPESDASETESEAATPPPEMETPIRSPVLIHGDNPSR